MADYKQEIDRIIETLLVRPLCTPGAYAEIEKLKEALTHLINKARIDELTMLPKLKYTQDGEVSPLTVLLQSQHIRDRIKELKK